MRGELGAEARFQQSPGRTEEAVLGQSWVRWGGGLGNRRQQVSILSSSSAVTGRRKWEAHG